MRNLWARRHTRRAVAAVDIVAVAGAFVAAVALGVAGSAVL